MAGFSADFSCLSQMSRDIQKIGAGVKKQERPVVKLMGNEYKNDVQALIPYKHGDLRRSVHVEPSEEGGHPISLVGSNKVYARQREYGGVIKAKNAPYLVFQLEDGTWIKTKQVYQHPQPAWRPAFDRNRVKYERMAKSVFNREDWESDLAVAETASGLRPDLTGGYL